MRWMVIGLGLVAALMGCSTMEQAADATREWVRGDQPTPEEQQRAAEAQRQSELREMVERGRYRGFVETAGSAEDALQAFHTIQGERLAEKQQAYESFPGDQELRACQRRAVRYPARVGRLVGRNESAELITAYLRQMPEKYAEWAEFQGCAIQGDWLDYTDAYLPKVEPVLREYPQLRTAEFKQAYTAFVERMGSLIRRNPDRDDHLLRRLEAQRLELDRFTP